MTPEEYYVLFEKQNGGCWLCGYKSDINHRGLHVDHNHKTGKVRGLLCRACNKDVIGAVEKIGLQKIIDYLYETDVNYPDPKEVGAWHSNSKQLLTVS